MNAVIAYFSGTGGTALAAKKLSEALNDRGACVTLREIRHDADGLSGSEDYIVLMYAVHALNAPLPVYKWLKSLGSVNGTPAAVIAVSGGGEISPNTAMRRSSIKKLEKKGYNVIYEESVVMPSNVLVDTPGSAVLKVMRALPKKAAMVADDILSGREKALKATLVDRALSRFCEMEKYGAKLFGRHLHAGETCNNCGKCTKGCPTGNIRMEEKPMFGKQCSLCLRCVYGCPVNAIRPKFVRSFILKIGFDIDALMKQAEAAGESESKDLPKGAAWKGVREYIEETESSSPNISS